MDMTGVKPTSGFELYPDGFYLLEVVDAKESKMENSGNASGRLYRTIIKMGPGWSQELVGKKFTDRIRETKEWAGSHMELFVACFGSLEAVQQLVLQHNGRLAAEMCEGRMYIAQIGTKGNYNNVIQRLPYTQQNWQENAGQPQGINMQPAHPAQAPLTPPAPTMPTPPPQQMMPIPQQQMPQMVAPPAPSFNAAPPVPTNWPQQQMMAPPPPPMPPGVAAR